MDSPPFKFLEAQSGFALINILVIIGVVSALFWAITNSILSLQNQMAELRIKRNLNDTLSTLSFMLADENICTANLAKLISSPLSEPISATATQNISDLNLGTQVVTAGAKLPINSDIFVQSLTLNNFQVFIPGLLYTADLIFDGELPAISGRIPRNADFKATLLLQTLNSSPLTFVKCRRIAADTNVGQILNDLCVNYLGGTYAEPICTLP